MIRGTNLTNNEFCDSGFVFVSEEKANSLQGNLAYPGDIVFTQRGTLGQVALIPHDAKYPRYVISQSQMKLTVDPNLADPYFVYLSCISPPIQKYIHDNAIAAGVPHINLGILKSIPIKLPADPTLQAKLAAPDRVLCDKVRLARITNQTLEAIAQAIFTSWFVDFEPVKAKAAVLAAGGSMDEAERAAMRAIAPALDAATAAQISSSSAAHSENGAISGTIDLRTLAAAFPSELVESELGLIPKGWKPSTYSEMFEARKGLSYKGEFLVDGDSGRPMVNLGCFGGGGSFNHEKVKRYCGPYRPQHVVKPGSLLVANTDMTQNRTILGSPIVAPEIDGDILFTHHTFAIDFNRNYHEGTYKGYVFYSLLRPEFRDRAEGFATGTTVLAMPKDALGKCEVIIPNSACVHLFNAVLYPIWESQSESRKQTKTLTGLRDLLLPQLLSGRTERTNG